MMSDSVPLPFDPLDPLGLLPDPFDDAGTGILLSQTMATTGVTTTAETQASTVEQTTLRPTPSTTTPAPVTTTQPTTSECI